MPQVNCHCKVWAARSWNRDGGQTKINFCQMFLSISMSTWKACLLLQCQSVWLIHFIFWKMSFGSSLLVHKMPTSLCFQPGRCQVEDTRDGRGKCLVTKRPLQPGEVLLSEQPLFVRPQGWSLRRRSHENSLIWWILMIWRYLDHFSTDLNRFDNDLDHCSISPTDLMIWIIVQHLRFKPQRDEYGDLTLFQPFRRWWPHSVNFHEMIRQGGDSTGPFAHWDSCQDRFEVEFLFFVREKQFNQRKQKRFGTRPKSCQNHRSLGWNCISKWCFQQWFNHWLWVIRQLCRSLHFGFSKIQVLPASLTIKQISEVLVPNLIILVDPWAKNLSFPCQQHGTGCLSWHKHPWTRWTRQLLVDT